MIYEQKSTAATNKSPIKPPPEPHVGDNLEHNEELVEQKRKKEKRKMSAQRESLGEARYTENRAEKVNNTADLISMLKKVFSNKELKVIVQCLQKIKAATDGLKTIQSVLRNLRLVIFRDQKTPSATDKLFDDKKECILQLSGFIPPRHKQAFDACFEPLLRKKASSSQSSSSFGQDNDDDSDSR